MRRAWCFLAAAICLLPLPALAQFDSSEVGLLKLGKEEKHRYRCGMTITARGGPSAAILGTAPVPAEWPEQQVVVVEEDVSTHVRKLRYRDSDGGLRQMIVSIPRLANAETATALITFEITRREILPLDNPENLLLPAELSRDLRNYLGTSPYINCRHADIREKAKELVEGKQTAWETVESIYNWVSDNIQLQNGTFKGAVDTLRDGAGQQEDRNALFIALCRANRIPARTVFVVDGNYAEFYLTDAEGNGVWLPCQLGAEKQLGSITDTKPILQKGDNYKPPEEREAHRFVSEFLTGKAGAGFGQPTVNFQRILLPAE